MPPDFALHTPSYNDQIDGKKSNRIQKYLEQHREFDAKEKSLCQPKRRTGPTLECDKDLQ